ncbi:unnamed protein product, partial [Symbiodinium sp. CCMP2456]
LRGLRCGRLGSRHAADRCHRPTRGLRTPCAEPRPPRGGSGRARTQRGDLWRREHPA